MNAGDASGYETRPAGPGDEPFLLDLYATTRDDLAALGLVGSQRDAVMRMQYDAQRRAYEAEYPRADHRIILVAGRPVGRVMVEERDGYVAFVDLALMPAHRGAGIGERVIRALLAWVSGTGKPARLSVTKANPAKRLYERLGFEDTGETASHYLMEWAPGRPETETEP